MSGRLDIQVYKGKRIVQPIVVLTEGQLVSLVAGTKARMMIRPNALSETILADLSSDNQRLTVDEAGAKVTINMSSAFTATFDFERAEYDVDLIYPSGETDRIAQGRVFVFPSVTR